MPSEHKTVLKTLPSGIRIIAEPMQESHSVAFDALFATGSRNEKEGEEGISHFLEHMMFKGTNTRNAKTIAESLDTAGASANACTSCESTRYHFYCLRENFDASIEIMGDMLTASTFPEEEITKEKGVILQEITGVNDTPDEIVFDKHMEISFKDQKLGKPILGSKNTISNFYSKDFHKYFSETYVTPKMIISIAGKNADTFIPRIEEIFNDNTFKAQSARTEEPSTWTGGEYREKRDLEQLQFVLGFSGKSYRLNSEKENALAWIATCILGRGMSSRLFLRIREELGLAYTVSSWHSSYSDSGMISIYAGTAPKNVKLLAKEISLEIKKAASEISKDELSRAIKQERSNRLIGAESTFNRAYINASSLNKWNRVRSNEEIDDLFGSITTDDIRRFFESMIANDISNMSVALIGDIDNSPSLPEIKEFFIKK